jgi:eukaryotic-like serine/threonine-protein kinase
MTHPSSRRGLALICLTLAVIVLLSPAGSAARVTRGTVDWPQYGFDEANTHHNPLETILDASNVGQVHGLWQAIGGSIGAPAVVAGVVYACASETDHVYALDASTGARLWASEQGITCASPAVANGRLFASDGVQLHALDAATGAELWSVPIGNGGAFAPPKVVGDTVYIGGTDGNMYAIDAATGVIRWTTPTGGILAAAAVGDGRVYVQPEEERLIALDAVTGTRLWWVDLGRGLVGFAPVFANGVVYATGYLSGTVYALDAATGTTLWTVHFSSCLTGNPTLGDGVLYVPFSCSDSSGVAAYDAAGGAEIWRIKLPDQSGIPSPIVTANGVAYVGTTSEVTTTTHLAMLDAATGQRLAWVFLGPGVYPPSTPIVVNGRIYVGSTHFYPTTLYAVGL